MSNCSGNTQDRAALFRIAAEKDLFQKKTIYAREDLKLSPEQFNDAELHVQTVDEARIELDKYLDEAILSAEQVTKVHGRGTVALRRVCRLTCTPSAREIHAAGRL